MGNLFLSLLDQTSSSAESIGDSSSRVEELG